MKQPQKFRKILLLLPVFMFMVPGLLAQKQDVDAIHLKDGNIYRGLLQEHSKPGVIKLETLCSNTLLFGMDEIDHISRESIRTGFRKSYIPSEQSGYYNRTDMGVLIGSGNNTQNAIFSLQMVNGYQYRGKLYSGLGIGIEFYDQAAVPLYADLAYYFSRRSVSPFLRGSIGYTISLEDPEPNWGMSVENVGGLLYAVGLGTSIRINQHNALALSLVYRFQSLKSIETTDWNSEQITINRQFNRISFRIGFVFD